MAVEERAPGHARLEDLLGAGVKRVRVHYADLIGTTRAKVIPVGLLEEAAEAGLNFCVSVFSIDHQGGMPEGTGLRDEVHFRDMQVVPDLSTLRLVPWEAETAICMGDCVLDGELLPAAPRSILRRAVAEAERHGVIASVGHELEFWLFRRGEDGRLERYAQSPGLVYRMDPRVDPGGVLRQMEEAVRDLGLPFTCANQEYDPSQWEINCRFATALEAADDAHFLKLAVKEVAAVNELVATFIGKPFGGGGTSGYHLHLSLWNGDGSNLFEDAAAPDGLSSQARWFIGGLMEHARELTAVLGPTVNAYKRYASMELGPYFVDWGLDNRSVFCRIPPERGRATRVECRAGDGAANAYLASAALLFAGLDGIDRELDPGPPSEGVYDPPVERAVMPLSLREALDELEGSKWAREKLGEQFIQAFAAIKRHEERRYQAFLALEHPSVRRDPLGVTTWEHEEYVEAL